MDFAVPNNLAGFIIVDEQEETLKGVEDGKDVVGSDEQRSVAEKSKSPGDAKKEEQAQNGGSVALNGTLVLSFSCFWH